MKKEQAQSQVEDVNFKMHSAPDGTKETNAMLSEDDVIRRLFMPANNLPEPRSEKAIVVVAAGGDERAVTHRQLENLLAHAVEQLRERGVKEGDKVVFYCDNCPELTATILACWSLHAMAALIDYRAERVDVFAMCKRLDAKLLLTSKKLYTDYAYETKLFLAEGLDVLDLSQFAEFKDSVPKSQFDIQSVNFDRPAFTILTSGTTGAPKTSVHTLRSLVRNIKDLADASNLEGESNITALTPLPMSHIFGLTVFLVAQALGLKTVLTPLEPVGFVKAVHKYKPELIAAFPQFYGAFLSAPKGFIKLNNARLLLCGGAPLTVSLASKFEETFGKRLNNGYGSTECKLVAFNKDGPVLSAGKPVGNVKVEIVNEQDQPLPDGKNGEVRISGSMLMEGYLDNETGTKKVLHDGHYYTGDIGRIENGYLFVVGRKGDVVIIGGVIVQTAEVEEVLRNYPQVKDVALTAVQNKRLGQIIKASVVLVDDKIAKNLKSTDPNEVLKAQQQLSRQFREYCKEHLSRYQRPMKWEFLGPHDSLPKTLAGKTDKKSMTGASL